MRWQDALRSRFAGREELCKDELYARYYQKDGLPKQDVLQCLELMESEYEVPAGLLRPQDNISMLADPVESKNLLKKFYYEGIAGDREFELLYQLDKRIERFGKRHMRPKIETIGDYVRAWCGQPRTVACSDFESYN